jgi:hypothetical protein
MGILGDLVRMVDHKRVRANHGHQQSLCQFVRVSLLLQFLDKMALLNEQDIGLGGVPDC